MTENADTADASSPVERAGEICDELYDIAACRLSMRPAAHNIRRMRRDASRVAALGEELGDVLGDVDPLHLRLSNS